MPGLRNYHAQVLVLKKTKLGEADLILSMLAGDGSLVKAVAKGARKPTSTFATRLDLFCESEVMLVRGRNLDIAREVRLINSHDVIRSNVLAGYAAAPVLDCLAQVALPDLAVEHLYAMASSALFHMDIATEDKMPAVTAAFLIKLFALLGIRPQLVNCVSCDAQRVFGFEGEVSFSYLDGGYVCDSCSGITSRVRIENTTLSWAQNLLASTFDEVLDSEITLEASFAVLHFAHLWLRETQNINLKSLNQLFTCGLF